ncbi:MAG: FMN-binding negative transcriptional regulator [Proteobacteria bacterium]|nr:FMN-binding negative transcriptional regulator [Pseudomonadota bacterium]
MYRPSAFAVDDLSVLHEFIAQHPFATIACVLKKELQFAYAPVVLDESGAFGVARFHLAMRNPVSEMADGARLSFSFMGPHAYVSPDWYRTLVTVPTWNYMAVQGTGAARRLSREELRTLLIDLSAQEEQHLLPKPPWLIDKVPPPRTEALLGAIVGFEVPFETLEGKFKLSQDKKPEDMAGVIEALEARGDAASAAVAKEMRKLK